MASCDGVDHNTVVDTRKNEDGQYEFRTRCRNCGTIINDWHL